MVSACKAWSLDFQSENVYHTIDSRRASRRQTCEVDISPHVVAAPMMPQH